MKDYDSLINEQCVIIHNEKNVLSRTDYQVLREVEGGTPMSAMTGAARVAARMRINAAEAEIQRLESERATEKSNEDLISLPQ